MFFLLQIKGPVKVPVKYMVKGQVQFWFRGLVAKVMYLSYKLLFCGISIGGIDPSLRAGCKGLVKLLVKEHGPS